MAQQGGFPGYNRYQNIMDAYAAAKPGAGDDALRESKYALASNLTEKAFDHDASKDMALTQAAITSGMMTHEANLAQRNETEARAQEFDYAEKAKASQFEHRNNFANAQYDRDVGMLNATGVQDRKNMEAQGQQDRLNTINEGTQNRLTIGAQGQQDRQNIQTQQNA